MTSTDGSTRDRPKLAVISGNTEAGATLDHAGRALVTNDRTAEAEIGNLAKLMEEVIELGKLLLLPDESKYAEATACLEAAHISLRKLESEHEEAEQRKLDMARSRQELAHSALAQGDKKAREKLENLSSEAGQIDRHLENLAAAMVAAKAHVSEMEQVESQGKDIDRARRAILLIRHRRNIAALITQMLVFSAAAFEAYIDAGRNLAGLTGKHTNPSADSWALDQTVLNAMFPLVQRGLLRQRFPDPTYRKKTLVDLATSADKIHANWAQSVTEETDETPRAS